MLPIAIQAAKKGGAVLNKYFGKLRSYESKNKANSDFVTKADKESEEIIKKIILTKFPTHGFWGEETGQTKVKSEYLWVVDPLDGTTNFIHRIPTHAVSIALMRKHQVILGVVYLPQTDELFHAQKGKGAFCNGQKIMTANTKKMRDAICSVGFWSKDRKHVKKGLEDFNYLARRVKKIRYLSSTVFELCRVAMGDLDFCRVDTTFLDIAAAKLIVEEAGGICHSTNMGVIPCDSKTIFRFYGGNKYLCK